MIDDSCLGHFRPLIWCASSEEQLRERSMIQVTPTWLICFSLRSNCLLHSNLLQFITQVSSGRATNGTRCSKLFFESGVGNVRSETWGFLGQFQPNWVSVGLNYVHIWSESSQAGLIVPLICLKLFSRHKLQIRKSTWANNQQVALCVFPSKLLSPSRKLPQTLQQNHNKAQAGARTIFWLDSTQLNSTQAGVKLRWFVGW